MTCKHWTSVLLSFISNPIAAQTKGVALLTPKNLQPQFISQTCPL